MKLTEEEKLLRYSKCSVCGGPLTFYAPVENPRDKKPGCMRYPEHKGIARKHEQQELNYKTWRENMTQEHGETKTTALERYQGVTTLTKPQASEIINTLWPEAAKASPAEVFKAVTICAQYGLNPLMNHLFLIPFNTKVGDKWEKRHVTVLGIKANRLIASRRHSYSYLDNTPRMMTAEEGMQVFGEPDEANLRAICILKDMKTGATARGYGTYPRATEPKGTDKGNSKANMAFIRAERQALDRLYPADMPGADIPVVDERFEEPITVTVEGHQVDTGTGEIQEPEQTQEPATTSNQESDATKSANNQPQDPGDWLHEALKKLKWKTVVPYLTTSYRVQGDTVSVCLKGMNEAQKIEFENEVKSRLKMMKPGA